MLRGFHHWRCHIQDPQGVCANGSEILRGQININRSCSIPSFRNGTGSCGRSHIRQAGRTVIAGFTKREFVALRQRYFLHVLHAFAGLESLLLVSCGRQQIAGRCDWAGAGDPTYIRRRAVCRRVCLSELDTPVTTKTTVN